MNYVSLFVKFSVIDMYHMDTVLSLILLDSQKLKIPRGKVEAYYFKKLDFVTNN